MDTWIIDKLWPAIFAAILVQPVGAIVTFYFVKNHLEKRHSKEMKVWETKQVSIIQRTNSAIPELLKAGNAYGEVLVKQIIHLQHFQESETDAARYSIAEYLSDRETGFRVDWSDIVAAAEAYKLATAGIHIRGLDVNISTLLVDVERYSLAFPSLYNELNQMKRNQESIVDFSRYTMASIIIFSNLPMTFPMTAVDLESNALNLIATPLGKVIDLMYAYMRLS